MRSIVSISATSRPDNYTAKALIIENYVCPKYVLEAMVRGGGGPWTSTI